MRSHAFWRNKRSFEMRRQNTFTPGILTSSKEDRKILLVGFCARGDESRADVAIAEAVVVTSHCLELRERQAGCVESNESCPLATFDDGAAIHLQGHGITTIVHSRLLL